MFLEREELATLTGRKIKTCQIKALRTMGIPFFVNATGHPIVARAVIEGRTFKKEAHSPAPWASNAFKTIL